MALTLTYSVLERNDNQLLTITDTTATATGWGVGGNPAITGIASATNKLTLDIKIKTSDGVETTYTQINLFDEFGAFTTQADLVFALDCHMLVSAGVPLGVAGDEFPDGIYEFTYAYNSPTVSTTGTVLLDGRVTVGVYELLRTIPTKYECGAPHEKETLDIIFAKAYLDSIHASAYVAREDSILNQLTVLERLITNGSTYTW
jgi:hypothetical protein